MKYVRRYQHFKRGYQQLVSNCVQSFDRWKYKYYNYIQFKLMLRLIVKIQRLFRFKKEKRELRQRIEKQRFLLKMFQVMFAKAKYDSYVEKVVEIQRSYRFYRLRKKMRLWVHFRKLIKTELIKEAWEIIYNNIRNRNAIIAQRYIRGCLSRKKYDYEAKQIREMRKLREKHKAARKIQKQYRGFVVRRYIGVLKLKALIIQSWLRMVKRRSVFLKLKRAAEKIQRNWRAWQFSKQVIRDLYPMDLPDPRQHFEELQRKERAVLAGLNHVQEMTVKDRNSRFPNKRPSASGLSFVESSLEALPVKKLCHTVPRRARCHSSVTSSTWICSSILNHMAAIPGRVDSWKPMEDSQRKEKGNCCSSRQETQASAL